MKRVGVLILVLCLVLQTFSRWVVLLNFGWNRDYISQNLCENRARPQLRCGGKCQLMKKMAAEEQKDQEQSKTKSSPAPDLYCATAGTGLVAATGSLKAQKYPPYSPEAPINRPASFFHPPDKV